MLRFQGQSIASADRATPLGRPRPRIHGSSAIRRDGFGALVSAFPESRKETVYTENLGLTERALVLGGRWTVGLVLVAESAVGGNLTLARETAVDRVGMCVHAAAEVLSASERWRPITVKAMIDDAEAMRIAGRSRERRGCLDLRQLDAKRRVSTVSMMPYSTASSAVMK